MSAGPFIAVLDYGIGNLRSAQRALNKVGADARLVSVPDQCAGASGVVLPGVGAFGPSVNALRESALDVVALRAIEKGLPFLGICVGLQLLYNGSEEDPSAKGLAVLDGMVVSLPPREKRPQMQWNQLNIRAKADQRMFQDSDQDEWAYFVHSFAPQCGPETVATCEYGGPVTAAIEDGPIWATQFHPEKSGRFGLRLLERFVRRCL